MSTNENFEKIVCCVLAFCMVVACFMYFPDDFGITRAVNSNYYSNQFFDDSYVHSIDIIVDPSSWQNLLDNASDKEYINCNLIIDNQLFTNIAIRAKGNSSLSMVNSSDSDRYSFKIEFDHYDNSKSYFGLDKLTLNNIIQDTSFMKDYLAYTLMGEFGVASPLVSYTEVLVNGENFGLYLGVEAIEEGFLQRNYGNNYGYAYKPETEGGGGGMAGGMPEGMEDIDPAMLMQIMQNVSQDEIFQAISDVTGMPLSEISFDMLPTLMTDSDTMTEVLSLLMGDSPMMGGQAQMGGQGQMGDAPMMGEQAQMGGQGQMGDAPMMGEQAQMGGQGQMGDAPMMGEQAQMGETPAGNRGEQAPQTPQTTDIPEGDRLVMGDRPLEPNVDGSQPMGQMGDTPMMGEIPGGAIPNDTMPEIALGQDNTKDELIEQGLSKDEVQSQQNQQSQGGRGQQGGGMGGMGGMRSSVSSALEYVDSNIDSYSYIFDNSVSNISANDKNRLISSLEQLSNNENLEKILDVEQVIRYFVVHNFLLNFDSYTGAIMHNYYIYEKNGQISMLPWDYNLSFVDFMNGGYTTQELVNFPIDTPVSTGEVEDRAILTWIFENDEYTELYHEIFDEFIETFFESGWAEEFILNTADLIDSYVESDPTKFITYDNFVTGVDALVKVVDLRSQSIRGQLDGLIPTTFDGQSADPSNLIQTGDFQITDTGSTQMGGQTQGGGGGGNRGEAGGTQSQGGDREQMGQMGEMGQMPEMGDAGAMPEMGGMPEQTQGQQTQGQQAQGQQAQGGDRGQMGQMGGAGGMNSSGQSAPIDYTLLYASLFVLFVALIVLKFYHKRKI